MNIKIALIQCKPVLNAEQALAILEQHIQQAKAEQAQLLIVPEMFLTGYNIGAARVREQALNLAKHDLKPLQALASRYQIALVVGFPEQDAGSSFNSASFIDEQGKTLSCYRKTHLFGGVDQAQFTAGEQLSTVFTWQGWRCALAICYDIEFPELARAYALQGAELLLVPTANMLPFDSVCLQTIPTRAAENTIYLAYANYVGSEAEFNYCGLSCICDPYGKTLARASSDREELLCAELRREVLIDAHQALRYLQDRRPQLYVNN